MLFLLAAASLAEPSSPLTGLIQPEDVPVALMKSNVRQYVGLALTVTPNGKTRACVIEKTSGNRSLDRYTCDLLRRRAKFAPPVFADGTPGHAVYRSTIMWWMGDGRPPPEAPMADLYLTVSTLPAGVASPFRLGVKFTVGPGGAITNCAPGDPSASAELGRIACQQLLASFRPAPALSAEGKPVPSLQNADVLFELNQ